MVNYNHYYWSEKNISLTVREWRNSCLLMVSE